MPANATQQFSMRPLPKGTKKGKALEMATIWIHGKEGASKSIMSIEFQDKLLRDNPNLKSAHFYFKKPR